MEQRRVALDLKSQLERLKLDTEYMRSRWVNSWGMNTSMHAPLFIYLISGIAIM